MLPGRWGDIFDVLRSNLLTARAGHKAARTHITHGFQPFSGIMAQTPRLEFA